MIVTQGNEALADAGTHGGLVVVVEQTDAGLVCIANRFENMPKQATVFPKLLHGECSETLFSNGVEPLVESGVFHLVATEYHRVDGAT